MGKIGGICRDQYFDRFFDYLRDKTDRQRKIECKKPFSDSTIRMYATDTFYLEKREDRDFKEWVKDSNSLEEAYKRLVYHLSGRINPENDAIY